MSQDYKASISVTTALSRSWSAVTNNIGPFAGFTLLYFVVSSILGKIPVLSTISSFLGFVYPVCIYYGFYAIDKYGSLSFNNFFDWITSFWKLLLGSLVFGLLCLVMFIPAVVIIVTAAGGLEAISEILQGYEAASPILLLSAGGLLLLFMIPVLLLEFSYLFLLCFGDHQIGYTLGLGWRVGYANIGSILVFALLALGIAILGILCLLVGLLVAMPVIVGIQYYFMRSIFPLQQDEEWDFMKDYPPAQ